MAAATGRPEAFEAAGRPTGVPAPQQCRRRFRNRRRDPGRFAAVFLVAVAALLVGGPPAGAVPLASGGAGAADPIEATLPDRAAAAADPFGFQHHAAPAFDAALDGLTFAGGGNMPADAARRTVARGLNRIEPAAGGNGGAPDGRGRPAPAAEPYPDDAAEPVGGTFRLRDFLRVLTTVRGGDAEQAVAAASPRDRAAAAPGRSGAVGDSSLGGSLLDLMLSMPVDSDLLEFLTKIVTPAIEPGQFVSFSIAGLGRFVLLFSVDDRSLRMVDLDGSFSLRLSGSRDSNGAIGDGYGPNPALMAARGSAGGPSAKEFLARLRSEVLAFLTNPLTIVGAIITGFLWLMWRMRGSTA